MSDFMPRYRLRALRPCLHLVPCPVIYPDCRYPRYDVPRAVPRVPRYDVPRYEVPQELPHVNGLG